jgi:hypothetical protein
MEKSRIYLFILGLFQSAFSDSDYTALNSWVSMEQRIRKDVKEVVTA